MRVQALTSSLTKTSVLILALNASQLSSAQTPDFVGAEASVGHETEQVFGLHGISVQPCLLCRDHPCRLAARFRVVPRQFLQIPHDHPVVPAATADHPYTGCLRHVPDGLPDRDGGDIGKRAGAIFK